MPNHGRLACRETATLLPSWCNFVRMGYNFLFIFRRLTGGGQLFEQDQA
jgi:hypothetical protein